MSTLAESIPRARASVSGRVVDVALVFSGAVLMIGLSQVAVPLPFTPVPITGQTLGVLLIGSSLGPVRGALSMALFLAVGATGLHVFAQGEGGVSLLGLASATGGYLWGFLVASAVVGLLARRGWDRSLRSSIGAMLIGEITIYAVALPWLGASLDVAAARSLELGLYPFVVGDLIKLAIAAVALPLAWRLVPAPSSADPEQGRRPR